MHSAHERHIEPSWVLQAIKKFCMLTRMIGGRERAHWLAVGLALLLALSVAGCGEDEQGGDANGDGAQETTESEGGGTNGDEASQDARGGDGGGDSEAQPASTKAEFIAQADQVCTRVKARLKQESQEYLAGPNAGSFKGVVDDVAIPRLEEEVSQIRLIDAPKEAQAAKNTVIRGFERMIAEARSEPQEFATEGASVARSEQLASKHGFKSCGPFI